MLKKECVPFVFVDGDLVLVLSDGNCTINSEHPNYHNIVKALANGTESEIKTLLDVKKAVAKFVATDSKGRATVDEDGVVCFDGKPVHNTLVTRIQEHMTAGLPFKHLLRFMERLDANPSMTARNELFEFLQNKYLPITEDGCFLGYKAIQKNYKDKHTGTIDNSPGSVIPRLTRREVDDNRDHECSYGYHVGALQYASQFGNQGNGDHLMVVKVDPADVVAVPRDSQFQKLRCCFYEVLREFDGVLTEAVYNSVGNTPVPSVKTEPIDWSYLDDEEDYYNEDDEDDYDEDDYENDDGYDDDDEEYYRDTYGLKPNGQRYHNKRDSSGKFTRKS